MTSNRAQAAHRLPLGVQTGGTGGKTPPASCCKSTNYPRKAARQVVGLRFSASARHRLNQETSWFYGRTRTNMGNSGQQNTSDKHTLGPENVHKPVFLSAALLNHMILGDSGRTRQIHTGALCPNSPPIKLGLPSVVTASGHQGAIEPPAFTRAVRVALTYKSQWFVLTVILSLLLTKERLIKRYHHKNAGLVNTFDFCNAKGQLNDMLGLLR